MIKVLLSSEPTTSSTFSSATSSAFSSATSTASASETHATQVTTAKNLTHLDKTADKEPVETSSSSPWGYHVMARGAGRKYIFKEESDKEKYLGCVRKHLTHLGSLLWYVCVMDNHVHMIVGNKTGREQISVFMKNVTHGICEILQVEIWQSGKRV